MILIYTKRPQKALDFLMKVCERMHEDGIASAKIVKTKAIYNTVLHTPSEHWEILPIDFRTRGKRWNKCYVDFDITENELKDIVLPCHFYSTEEGRWDRPMIFI